MADLNFEERFDKAFENGLVDIKFFVKRSERVMPDALRADALLFQEAIDAGKYEEVDSVD